MALKLHISNTPLKLKVYSGTAAIYPIYDGDYEVTPATYDVVTLPTAQKLMRDDVEVKVIPQFAVSNAAGGETLIIGKEYWDYGN
nr:MAG TPA: hypothetical protein [Caudoviricetes sp.]